MFMSYFYQILSDCTLFKFQGMIGLAMRRLVRGGCPFTLWRLSSSQVNICQTIFLLLSDLCHISCLNSSQPSFWFSTDVKLAVISMLADPNDESPANVDAAKEWRDSYPEFK